MPDGPGSATEQQAAAAAQAKAKAAAAKAAPKKTTVTKPSTGSTGSKSAVVQPGFASNIMKIASPLSGVNGGPDLPVTTIQRGYIVQAKPFAGYKSGTAGLHVFNFLYNPSSFSASFQVQTSGVATSYLFSDPSDAANPVAPTNNSVSFTVLFDRTYDLWQSYNTDGTSKYAGSQTMKTGGNDARVVGVQADIWQLMYLTGMFQTGQQINADNSGTSQVGTILQGTYGDSSGAFSTTAGFMEMVPCWLNLNPSSGVTQYYGYISYWDYTITHFTQYMIPMRCSIDITMTLLPQPALSNGLPYSLGSGGANASYVQQLRQTAQQTAQINAQARASGVVIGTPGT